MIIDTQPIRSSLPPHVGALMLINMPQLTAPSRNAADHPQEAYRPQFHFTPPQQWMNDPNGMVFYRGEYHLFYQYNPYASTWGPMHWGHAVSSNLIDWHHRPIALFPDVHGAIFSGSAVIDWENTSGFGSPDNPAMVAVYTYHDHLAESRGERGYQTQGIAYSTDRGRTWVKYAGNPVLRNPSTKDFRDPKVTWYAPQSKWVMSVAVGDYVSFYSSKDLKSWQHESDFGRGAGAHGGVWECPDLFEMQIENEPECKHVLLVSLNPGGPNGGSGTQYFVGSFDGHTFVLHDTGQVPPESSASVQWLDYGTDNYAAVSWSDVPAGDGRRLIIGWMNNWEYAQKVPTQPWRGAMTLPRELRLVRTDTQLELHSLPVKEAASLRKRAFPLSGRNVRERIDLTELAQLPREGRDRLEIDLTLAMGQAQLAILSFANAANESTLLRIDRNAGKLELDRQGSGATSFSENFGRRMAAPLPTAETLQLRIFLDVSSIEVFVNGGARVLTASLFPTQPYDRVFIEADQPVQLCSGALYLLRSIWTTKNDD